MEIKEFSELLNHHIHESGYTNYEFARIVGINRVNIQRYLSGARVPNRHTFEMIADELHLGNKEREELFESYQCAFDGKDTYYLKKTIREILESAADLCGIEKGNIVLESSPQEKDLEIVHGKAALEKYIWSLLYHTSQSEEGQTIYCFVPGERQILGRTFPTDQKRGESILKNVKIVHLVQLTKRADVFQDRYHNLRVLRNLLPTYFQAGKSYETLFYYHDQPQLEFNDGLLYPYYIIFPECILFIDAELESALSVKHPDVVRQHLLKIERRYSGGGIKKLVRYYESEEDILRYEMLQDQESENRISLDYEPCFVRWADEELLEAIINESVLNRGNIISRIKVRIQQLRDTEEFIHYFTEEGLREFVDTGHLNSYPESLVRLLTREERLLLLDRMIADLKQDKGNFGIINRKYLKITRNLALFISDCMGVIFILQNEQKQIRYIQIMEGSICRAFTEYVKSMHEQEMVLSKEETRAVLIKYRNMLRKE